MPWTLVVPATPKISGESQVTVLKLRDRTKSSGASGREHLAILTHANAILLKFRCETTFP
jgi:hypothetical protein